MRRQGYSRKETCRWELQQFGKSRKDLWDEAAEEGLGFPIRNESGYFGVFRRQAPSESLL